jgi:nucleoid-associated protein YgaU
VEKAKIRNADANSGSNDYIECLFNPNEYTFVKQNSWTPHPQKGGDLPRLEFGGGSSQTLTMQLFLDTTTSQKDVRTIIQKILDLMKVDASLKDGASDKGRPPRVEFFWGSVWSFKAVITRLTQKCTLFSDDGVPVRATLDVDFLQAEESQMQPQNPTTRGKAGYKKYIVEDGDSIDWIAFNEYGDASQWRFLADANGLDDPRRIKPGQVLSVPPLS